MPVTGGLFHSADTYWMPIICWALCQAVEPGMNQIPAHRREGVGETDSKAGEPEMHACPGREGGHCRCQHRPWRLELRVPGPLGFQKRLQPYLPDSASLAFTKTSAS